MDLKQEIQFKSKKARQNVVQVCSSMHCRTIHFVNAAKKFKLYTWAVWCTTKLSIQEPLELEELQIYWWEWN